MSKELEKLENMAKIKCITDHEHIEKILDYMLSLPLSHFRKDKKRFDYLQKDISNGFDTTLKLDSMPLRDILTLIGYEPGNRYYEPPDIGRRMMGSRFNAAGHCYILALLLDSNSKSDIHIREFLCIQLSAFTDYLEKKITEDRINNLISASSAYDMFIQLEKFKDRISTFMNDGKEEAEADSLTIGKVISGVISECARPWTCSVMGLDHYAGGIISAFDIASRLFMDAVRMPLIHSGRERFKEIIRSCSYSPDKTFESMDYEECYEHSGVSGL